MLFPSASVRGPWFGALWGPPAPPLTLTSADTNGQKHCVFALCSTFVSVFPSLWCSIFSPHLPPYKAWALFVHRQTGVLTFSRSRSFLRSEETQVCCWRPWWPTEIWCWNWCNIGHHHLQVLAPWKTAWFWSWWWLLHRYYPQVRSFTTLWQTCPFCSFLIFLNRWLYVAISLNMFQTK